jgi:lamin B
MSSKARRGTPQPKLPQEEQPSSSDPRPLSPVSQVLYTRQEEKKNLQSLNDRLANYIDTVRTLQSENEILRQTIEKTETTIQTESVNVKHMYEKELSDARKIIEKLTTEKAAVQQELRKEKATREELSNRSARLQKELTALENKVVAAENDARNARTEAAEAVAKIKRLEAEKKDVGKEMDELKKALTSSKKELDAALLAKDNAENKFRALEESAKFEKEVIQEELNRSRSNITIVRQNIEQQYEERLEQRLGEELAELRADNEEKLRRCRLDLTERYEAQINQMKKTLNDRANNETKFRSDIQTLTSKCTNLESHVKNLEGIRVTLDERIVDLGKQLDQERQWHQQGIQEKDKEIASLNDKIKTHLQEYQELYDTKVGLTLEIDAYRKLLEGEESRLDSRPQSRVSAYAVSPRPGSRGQKRFSSDLRPTEIREKYVTEVNTEGPVAIIQTDPEKSRFVQIKNQGTTDVSLNGWQLQRKVGGDTATTHKFHRAITIKAGETITVWGSNAEGKVNNPPNNITMKNAWASGPQFSTVLVDAEGSESSVCNNRLEKSESISPFKRIRRSLSGTPVPEEEGQQCSIM